MRAISHHANSEIVQSKYPLLSVTLQVGFPNWRSNGTISLIFLKGSLGKPQTFPEAAPAVWEVSCGIGTRRFLWPVKESCSEMARRRSG
jgi:hypothetical protein